MQGEQGQAHGMPRQPSNKVNFVQRGRKAGLTSVTSPPTALGIDLFLRGHLKKLERLLEFAG